MEFQGKLHSDKVKNALLEKGHPLICMDLRRVDLIDDEIDLFPK